MKTLRINRRSPQARGLVAWVADVPPISSSGAGTIRDSALGFASEVSGAASVIHASGRRLIRFNGTSTLIYASAVPWAAAPPKTLSAWLVVRSNSAFEYKMMASAYTGSETSIIAIAKSNTNELYYYADGAGRYTTNPLTVFDTLRHYCLVLTATTAAFYIDGVSVPIAQPTGGFPNLGSPVLRMGDLGGGIAPDSGDGCDYRVYDRALTPAEVWALYDPRTRYDLYEYVDVSGGEADPVSSGAISGSSAGAATTSGAITGSGALAGSSAGAATVTGALSSEGAIAGSSAGAATTAGALDGAGALAGAVAGAATVAGSLDGAGALAGAVAGTSTTAGALDGAGAIAGAVAGAATTSGALTGSVECVGSVAGTSTVSGTLDGTSSGISGTSAGAATVSGALAGAGALEGAIAGAASVTATIWGALPAEGSVAGTCTVAGSLEGSVSAIGSVAGTCTTAGTLLGSGALVGSAAGTSTASLSLLLDDVRPTRLAFTGSGDLRFSGSTDIRFTEG